MAAGSEAVSFKKYGVQPVCAGCGRKLIKKDEPAMWFVGLPMPAVYGSCCWGQATRADIERRTV